MSVMALCVYRVMAIVTFFTLNAARYNAITNKGPFVDYRNSGTGFHVCNIRFMMIFSVL
jgi:hypothetical protein